MKKLVEVNIDGIVREDYKASFMEEFCKRKTCKHHVIRVGMEYKHREKQNISKTTKCRECEELDKECSYPIVKRKYISARQYPER